ncbi:Uma2 family endonuclease [Nocardioides ginsengisoli]|uniref:Uma2 family endonuclease n=1 Tax=Nocardioides ginsengisoli TaxID=363868 RepID=A0ABW3W1V2_9ACTN
MGAMTLVRPPAPKLEPRDLIVREGPFTVAERDAIPDNGYRHELLDGLLLMTPAPLPPHQDVVGSLYVRMRAAVPRELKVYLAPFDVYLDDRNVLEPDLLVTRRSDVKRRGLFTAPLLAVEMISPSTRSYDLGPKMEILAAAGCPSYWTIDPKVPELTAWTLREGRYVEEARVAAQETWTATEPFPVAITPTELLDL